MPENEPAAPVKRSLTLTGSDLQTQHEKLLSKKLGFDISDSATLERVIFSYINDGERDKIQELLEMHPSPTTILQILLTCTYPNRDGHYRHEAENLVEAEELLGAR